MSFCDAMGMESSEDEDETDHRTELNDEDTPPENNRNARNLWKNGIGKVQFSNI